MELMAEWKRTLFQPDEKFPQAWRDHWDDFQAWRAANHRCGRQIGRLPEEAAFVFDLPDPVLPLLREVGSRIRQEEQLYRLALLWHYLIFHVPPGEGGFANGWPLPRRELGDGADLFPLAVLVSGTEHARNAYRIRGVAESVERATLAFGGLYTRDFYARHGRWGLSELGWLKNHVHARIFRLGRLVFNAATYRWPFLVLRGRHTGQIVALCDGGEVRYRQDGLPDGTNNRFETDAWTPFLDRTEDRWTGFPVTAEGRVRLEPVSLDRNGWEPVLARGDRVVEVHIPSGGKLLEAECREAFREAKSFFARLYPEDRFAAFTCRSWIMDPALADLLPESSNLVVFQRSFHPLPLVGDERQTYDLVFGDPDVDLSRVSPKTNLQRAIIDYVKRGNRMRSSAGFRLWNDVE
jgi:hypothetical protein